MFVKKWGNCRPKKKKNYPPANEGDMGYTPGSG